MTDQSNEEQRPIFEADFGRYIGIRKFYTAQDLVDFATRTRDAFAWLKQVPGMDSQEQNITGQAWKFIERLRLQAESLASAVSGSDQVAIHAAKEGLTGTSKAINERHLLGYDDPRAEFVNNVAKSDGRRAVLILGYFTGSLTPQVKLPELVAIVQASMFDLGGMNFEPSAKASIEQLLTAVQRRHAEVSSQLAASSATLGEMREEKIAEQASQATAFQETQAERDKTFSEKLVSIAADLDAFKRAYNEELATASAVKYWGDKAVIHRWLAALAAGATGLAGIVYFGVALPKAFVNLIDHFGVKPDQPQWRAGIAVALVLLGIWLARILVRMFFSQMHLAADASHRRITMLSYIALLKNEQQAVTPEDRSIVLGTIFRPISDGIIRDDAMPPSPWELLTRPPKSP